MQIQFANWKPSDFESRSLIEAGQNTYKSSHESHVAMEKRIDESQKNYEDTLYDKENGIANNNFLDEYFLSQDNIDQNPQAYSIYKSYKDELSKLTSTSFADLATRKNALLALRGKYNNEIRPLKESVTTYNTYKTELQKLKTTNPEYIQDGKNDNVTFDEFLANREQAFNFDNVDSSKLHTKAKDIGASYSARNIHNSIKDKGWFIELFQEKGYNNKETNAHLLDTIDYFRAKDNNVTLDDLMERDVAKGRAPKDSSYYQFVRNHVIPLYEEFTQGKNMSDTMKERTIATILSGLSEGFSHDVQSQVHNKPQPKGSGKSPDGLEELDGNRYFNPNFDKTHQSFPKELADKELYIRRDGLNTRVFYIEERPKIKDDGTTVKAKYLRPTNYHFAYPEKGRPYILNNLLDIDWNPESGIVPYDKRLQAVSSGGDRTPDRLSQKFRDSLSKIKTLSKENLNPDDTFSLYGVYYDRERDEFVNNDNNDIAEGYSKYIKYLSDYKLPNPSGDLSNSDWYDLSSFPSSDEGSVRQHITKLLSNVKLDSSYEGYKEQSIFRMAQEISTALKGFSGQYDGVKVFIPTRGEKIKDFYKNFYDEKNMPSVIFYSPKTVSQTPPPPETTETTTPKETEIGTGGGSNEDDQV